MAHVKQTIRENPSVFITVTHNCPCPLCVTARTKGHTPLVTTETPVPVSTPLPKRGNHPKLSGEELAKDILAQAFINPQSLRPRHRTFLNTLDDPMLMIARDVILAGPAAVAQVGHSDPVLAGFISDITTTHRPSVEDIAQAAFKQTGQTAVMVAPMETAGGGEWPETPARSNAAAKCRGSVIILKPVRGHYSGEVCPRFSGLWREDDREYFFRVKREVEKVHAEAAYHPMFYQTGLDQTAVARLIGAWNQRKKRAKQAGQEVPIAYQVYPQENGSHVVVTNQPKDATGTIPADRAEAVGLFDGWLRTPEDMKLNRHSSGYGRQFQGTSGDGRRAYNQGKREMKKVREEEGLAFKSLQLISDKKPDDLLAIISGIVPVIGRKFELNRDQLGEFANKMRAALPDLKTRSGDSSYFAIHALLECTKLTDTLSSSIGVSPTLVHFPPNDTPEREIDRLMGGSNT